MKIKIIGIKICFYFKKFHKTFHLFLNFSVLIIFICFIYLISLKIKIATRTIYKANDEFIKKINDKLKYWIIKPDKKDEINKPN